MKKIFFISILIMINRFDHIQTAQRFKIEKLNKKARLSPIQKLQLDFLKEELTMYSKQAQTAWVDNVNVLLIVESAQLLLASSNEAIKQLLKDEIITIFKDIQIPIEITPQNIIKKINTDQKDTNKKSTKKNIKNPTPKPYQPPQLNRIHGAGRTLRQIKERHKPTTRKDDKFDWENVMKIISEKTESNTENKQNTNTEKEFEPTKSNVL